MPQTTPPPTPSLPSHDSHHHPNLQSQPSISMTPLLLFLLLLIPTVHSLPHSDLSALYSLRASLALRAHDWPRKQNPCLSWTGVTCRSDRVLSLSLSGLRRTRRGRLSPAFDAAGLLNLTRLEVFNASGFSLPGPIPAWFGNLSSLVKLDLSKSGVTGTVPPDLARLRRLNLLDLSFNRLSGPVPPELGEVAELVEIDLSSNSFTGPVPPEFRRLRKVERLVLRNNGLVGDVPREFGELKRLRVLDLGGNSLSGVVPVDIGKLEMLERLDLGNNSLEGALPVRVFDKVRRIKEVVLGHNALSSEIPESLWRLPELRVLDLSYNKFSGVLSEVVGLANASGGVFDFSHNLWYGALPKELGGLSRRLRFLDVSGNYFEGGLLFDRDANVSIRENCFRNVSGQRSLAKCTEFYSSRGLSYVGAESTPPLASKPRKKSNRKLLYILVGSIGGFVSLVLLVVMLILCWRRCGRRTTTQPRDVSTGAAPAIAANQPSVLPLSFSAVGDSFTYDQLLLATSNFSDANLIKHGHSGDLYHGALEGGAPVVVKRVDIRVFKKEQYLVELDFFARASHTRLVPLLGHCMENENEKLLVYKYMPNGDLGTAFYRKSGQGEGLQSIDWITRSKIAIGVAEALCYLHHECVPPLVHRDIQGSSVLLDDKFEVRLGSLSEVCTQEGDGHQNVINRFLRLSRSEPSTSGLSSTTCAYDVYCLGKVLLELVTGKLGISGSNEESTNEWVEQTMTYINIYEKELLTKILDPSLVIDEDLMEEAWAMAIVAKSCLNSKPSRRPPVKYILKALENPLKVVREDNSLGSARLRATSSRGSWNAAVFGSWRSSSDIASASAPPRDASILKPSGSHGSGREQSFNHRRRPSKDVCPEPSIVLRDVED